MVSDGVDGQEGRGPVDDAYPGGGTGVPSGEEGPIGPFPNWRWVYGTVLVYGVGVILGLWILTRVLDPGAGP